jgi:fructokinase
VTIVCLGELLMDLFPAEQGAELAAVSAFLPVPGGAPANVAVAAARLGADTAFMGKVGDDGFGRRLASVLKENAVDTRGLRFDQEARTTLNFLTLPTPNSYECLFYRGADALFSPQDIDAGLLREAAVFHFGSVSLTEEPCRSATLEAARLAREAGALVSFDVNYRPTLWLKPAEALPQIRKAAAAADLLKVNESELRLLAGGDDPESSGGALLDLGPAILIVTLGEEGCALVRRSGCARYAGFRLPAVDATGCGDAFVGAWLVEAASLLGPSAKDRAARLAGLSEQSLAAVCRFANAAGALTATKKGVIPALPARGRVLELLGRTRG